MKIAHFLAAVLMIGVFGLNYSVIKLGLNSFDPLLLAGLRFSLCAFPIIFFIKKPICHFKYVALYGIFEGLGLWSVLLGLHAGLSAGISALDLQFGAFMTSVVGVFIFKDKITKFNICGFIFSLAGLGLIATITDGSVTRCGMIFALLGAAFWVAANTALKKSGTNQPFKFIIWSSPISAFLIFSIRLITREGGSLQYRYFDLSSILALLFTAYVTALFAYSIWAMLLSKYRLTISAPAYLLVPISSMGFSHLIFNEPIGTIKIIAAMLIVSGVLINTCGRGLAEFINSRAVLP